MTNEQMAQRLEVEAAYNQGAAQSCRANPDLADKYGNLAFCLRAGAAALRDVELLREALLWVRDRCTSAGQGTAYGELKDIRNYVPGDMRWCVELIDSALNPTDRKKPQEEADNENR